MNYQRVKRQIYSLCLELGPKPDVSSVHYEEVPPGYFSREVPPRGLLMLEASPEAKRADPAKANLHNVLVLNKQMLRFDLTCQTKEPLLSKINQLRVLPRQKQCFFKLISQPLVRNLTIRQMRTIFDQAARLEVQSQILLQKPCLFLKRFYLIQEGLLYLKNDGKRKKIFFKNDIVFLEEVSKKVPLLDELWTDSSGYEIKYFSNEQIAPNVKPSAMKKLQGNLQKLIEANKESNQISALQNQISDARRVLTARETQKSIDRHRSALTLNRISKKINQRKQKYKRQFNQLGISAIPIKETKGLIGLQERMKSLGLRNKMNRTISTTDSENYCSIR